MDNVDFQIKYKRKIENDIVEHGIIHGNNKIVLIKPGAQGTLYGYNNKYLTIANQLNNMFGCTVFCTSNPATKQSDLSDEMYCIKKYCDYYDLHDYSVHFFGLSNGALQGIWHGHKYPEIKEMILVNGPLMLNYHKTKEGIIKSKEKAITFIYGKYDPSYLYTKILKEDIFDNCKLIIFEDTDHNFTNNINEFVSLPSKYFVFN